LGKSQSSRASGWQRRARCSSDSGGKAARLQFCRVYVHTGDELPTYQTQVAWACVVSAYPCPHAARTYPLLRRRRRLPRDGNLPAFAMEIAHPGMRRMISIRSALPAESNTGWLLSMYVFHPTDRPRGDLMARARYGAGTSRPSPSRDRGLRCCRGAHFY